MNNLIVNKKEGCVNILVNPKIYSLDVIYSAAYVFIDKAYIILDGDPDKEIKIELKLKSVGNEADIGRVKFEKELYTLGRDFLNELLNYAFYKKQSEKNKKIRESIVQTALIGNLSSDDISKSLYEDIDFESIEDPEGIAIPWEEKYGTHKKDNSQNKKTINHNLDYNLVQSKKINIKNKSQSNKDHKISSDPKSKKSAEKFPTPQ